MDKNTKILILLLIIAFLAGCSPSVITKMPLSRDSQKQQEKTSLNQYKVSVSVVPDGAGRIVLLPYKETFTAGTTVNLVAKANFGFVFDYWKKDQTGGNYIVMNGNKKVVAIFKRVNFLPFLLIGIVALLIIIVFRKSYLCKKSQSSVKEDQNKMDLQLSDKIFSLDKNASVQFVLSLWRIEQRIKKIQTEVKDNELITNSCKAIDNALQKIDRYISDNQLEIMDYSNQKYNAGLNVEVLAFETKDGSFAPLIKESVEPMILKNGQLIHKAKVIVLTPKEEQNGKF